MYFFYTDFTQGLTIIYYKINSVILKRVKIFSIQIYFLSRVYRVIYLLINKIIDIIVLVTVPKKHSLREQDLIIFRAIYNKIFKVFTNLFITGEVYKSEVLISTIFYSSISIIAIKAGLIAKQVSLRISRTGDAILDLGGS